MDWEEYDTLKLYIEHTTFIEIMNQTFMETNLVCQDGPKNTSLTMEDAIPLQHRITFIRQSYYPSLLL